MSYLDVAPMMTALRTTPDAFEFKDGWLKHLPSRHNFRFGPDGKVQISAYCDCAQLAVMAEQEKDLYVCFREWETKYWRPLEINREFASHFRQRSPLRHLLITATAWLHDCLVRGSDRQHNHRKEALVPAE